MHYILDILILIPLSSGFKRYFWKQNCDIFDTSNINTLIIVLALKVTSYIDLSIKL